MKELNKEPSFENNYCRQWNFVPNHFGFTVLNYNKYNGKWHITTKKGTVIEVVPDDEMFETFDEFVM